MAVTLDANARARMTTPGRFADLAALRRWLDSSRQSPSWVDWSWQVRSALDAVDLARLGLLQPMAAAEAAIRYPVCVTPYYLDAGELSDPTDPLRRQWLPEAEECDAVIGDSADPFGEVGSTSLPGVVHRFPDRILVLTSARCAVRCRHCTRKNALEGCTVVRRAADVRAAVDYVRTHPKVREVILSGGDPLLDGDTSLLRLVRAFAALPQIDAVRIGTRVPATLPMRVTAALAQALGGFGKVWVNTQFNHAAELSVEAVAACARLVEAGIPVSNQTVLLKGVNDSVEALVELCSGLQRARVRPYYVFICDPVAGTAHFRVSSARAAELSDALSRRVGGLAMPRFVADIPGAAAKTDVHALLV